MDRSDPAGGSLRLAGLIDRYGDHLIPDLKRYYGIDLRDLFSEVDPLSPRFVLAHIDNLPLGSPTVAEMRGGQRYRDWDERMYLIAKVFEELQALSYITLMIHRDPKKREPEPPTGYPIPGSEQRRKRQNKPVNEFTKTAASLIEKAREAKRQRRSEWQASEVKR